MGREFTHALLQIHMSQHKECVALSHLVQHRAEQCCRATVQTDVYWYYYVCVRSTVALYIEQHDLLALQIMLL